MFYCENLFSFGCFARDPFFYALAISSDSSPALAMSSFPQTRPPDLPLVMQNFKNFRALTLGPLVYRGGEGEEGPHTNV